MENYRIFPKFIIRTHENSFNLLKEFYKKDIEDLFSQIDIQEAIYIASLDLYEKLKRYSLLENKEKEQVRNSFIRYINRMSTRCTPFGLFAGCAIGTMGEITNLIVSQVKVRHTRLDMSYLCSLSQYLSDIPEIKCKLRYYPNNSLYIVGNEYRYIEYCYLKDERIHQISSVKKTSYLDKILHVSKKGMSIEDLYPYIINEYIPKDDVINYINDLIQAQILISELDPTVTGDDFLTRIISILDSINLKSQISDILKTIQYIIKQIDQSDGDLLNKYEEIENFVKSIGAPYNRKYLFQVDINNKFISSTIGASIRKEINATVTFLNNIIPIENSDNMLKFKEEFVKRFDGKEIPLLIALDPEIGIGYPIENRGKDISPLLNNFKLSNNLYHIRKVEYSAIQSILLKKISEQNDLFSEIEIKDEDFQYIKENRINLPNTFAVLFDIIRDNGDDILIRPKSIGGSSAANLFARFAYTDNRMKDFVKEIVQKEQSLNPDAILAEIVHLPDYRVGNVLFRPHLRDYEIVYLTNSSMSKEKVIYASDLMLSVKYGRLFLRSKRLNKEIIPHLTNAHNYSLSTIPIYRFLCDMQYQEQRASLTFDIGFLRSELSYVPRIRYRHTILSPAIWNIRTDEIKHIISIKEDESFLYKANLWRQKRKIPNYSLLSDGDNELFIDWTDVISLRAFLSVIKNRISFRLTEFLFNEKDAVVRDENGNAYSNECIVLFEKNKK